MDILIAIIIGVIVGIPIGYVMAKYYKFIMIKWRGLRPKFTEFHFKPTENDDYLVNLRNDKINETFSLFFLGKNGERIKYKHNNFHYSYWDLLWRIDKDVFVYDLIKTDKGINELIQMDISWNPIQGPNGEVVFQSPTDGIEKALNNK